jgi:hypothetical protein
VFESRDTWCLCFAAGLACYSWWLPPPRRLGAARIVERRLVIVRGSGPFLGGEPKGTRIARGLCDPHLVLVMRHPIEGLACDAN